MKSLAKIELWKTRTAIDENSRNVEKIIISPKKRKNIKQVNTSIVKIELSKISKLSNYSSVSRFLAKIMDWSKWLIRQSIFC